MRRDENKGVRACALWMSEFLARAFLLFNYGRWRGGARRAGEREISCGVRCVWKGLAAACMGATSNAVVYTFMNIEILV